MTGDGLGRAGQRRAPRGARASWVRVTLPDHPPPEGPDHLWGVTGRFLERPVDYPRAWPPEGVPECFWEVMAPRMAGL
jgi:hypothetical protein